MYKLYYQFLEIIQSVENLRPIKNFLDCHFGCCYLDLKRSIFNSLLFSHLSSLNYIKSHKREINFK